MSGPPPKAKPTLFGLPPVPFAALYRFATPTDLALSVLGALSGLASGTVLPLFTIVFGNGLDSFNSPLAKTEDIVASVSTYSFYFLLIAIGAGFLCFAEVALTNVSVERQMARMRAAYAKNLLRLDPAWYDTHRTGEAVARLAESSISVAGGMSKVSTVLRYTSSLIVGIVIGFRTSWKLTLVVMACAPIFTVALGILIFVSVTGEKRLRQAYSRAGGSANEAISLSRAVAAYGGETHESQRYDFYLALAEAAGFMQGRSVGLAVGVMVSTFYAMYGISTWAGAMFIITSREDNSLCLYIPSTDGCFTGGQVITTFIAVLLGALSFGSVGPLIGAIAGARAAASDLYGVIDAKPGVDVDDDSPALHRGPAGATSGAGMPISFRNVTFAYPSRPDVVVLRDFSLDIGSGEQIGVVGTSGSGKSTLTMLIMRAYDPQSGEVLVDGVDVRQWHLPTLRAKIGFVQQSPELFGISIADNIALGVPDAARGGAPAVPQADIERAARSANAHDFIAALPEGYATTAGSGVSSSQLSGGQRQRICIARAVIRRPQIMLLDEATSALDTKSERVVQAALDAIGREQAATTLVIAHRLATLGAMSRIVVLERGTVVESGTHAELAAKEGGLFRAMLQSQAIEDPGLAAAPPTASRGSLVAAAEGTAAGTAEGTAEGKAGGSAEGKAGGSAEGKAAPGGLAVRKAAALAPAASKRSVLGRLLRIQRKDWALGFVGTLAAAGGGCLSPCLAQVYGGVIAVFFSLDNDVIRRTALEYLGYFAILALACFTLISIRISIFTRLGERLTRKLRDSSFRAIERMPAAFFDDPANSVGTLTTRLATDATLVKGASGDAIGSAFEASGAIISGLVIGFVASWRLALVLFAAYPLLIIGGYFEFNSFQGIAKQGNDLLEKASTALSEAVSASRVVAAFGLQPRTYALYVRALEQPRAAGIRGAFVTGFGQSFQRFMLQCTYALAFFAGGQMINRGWLNFGELIRCFLAVTLSAEAMGRITSQTPDTAKAATAAAAIFALIDAGDSSPIDPLAPGGAREGATPPVGGVRIEFRDVHFAYPTRPDTPVLAGFSLVVEPGQSVGVVGQSGSGKSTLVLLVGRAYDVDAGAVLVDGRDVREWNVAALRATLGLVQQEPALFADSIA